MNIGGKVKEGWRTEVKRLGKAGDVEISNFEEKLKDALNRIGKP